LRQGNLAQRGEAQVIAMAIAKPINAECGRLARNPQGTGRLRHIAASLVAHWEQPNVVPRSLPCTTNTSVVAAWNLEIGSSAFQPFI